MIPNVPPNRARKIPRLDLCKIWDMAIAPKTTANTELTAINPLSPARASKAEGKTITFSKSPGKKITVAPSNPRISDQIAKPLRAILGSGAGSQVRCGSPLGSGACAGSAMIEVYSTKARRPNTYTAMPPSIKERFFEDHLEITFAKPGGPLAAAT